MWKKLLKYRPHAKTFHRVLVGNGRDVSFWFDNWSVLGRLHDTLGDRGFIEIGISGESTVAAAVADHRRRRHRLDFLNHIEDILEDIRIRGLVDSPDVPLWRGKGDQFHRVFSSHDMWNCIRVPRLTVPWHKGIWFSHSTPKFGFITWLSVLNRLATGDRMLHWNTDVSTDCVLCQGNLESRNHLFFLCRFSGSVWRCLAGNLLGTRFTTSYEDILHLLSGSHTSPDHRYLLKYLFQATIYSLWQERNRRRHSESPLSAQQLTIQVDRILRNRLSSLRWPTTIRFQNTLLLWFSLNHPTI